jgi:hypothetical protein
MIENIYKKIYLPCFVPRSLRLRNNPAFPNNGAIQKLLLQNLNI